MVDPGLDTEIADCLIIHLALPPTLPPAVQLKRDVLFPAHIIGMVIVEAWRAGQMDRLRGIFTFVIKALQSTVKVDDMPICAYWLANMYELVSVVRTAMEDAELNSTMRLKSNLVDTERTVAKYKNDLDNFMMDTYYNWLKELKRVVDKMIVPAIIEHQGLPGFIDDASTSVGFLNKLMGAATPVLIPTEKLITYLDRLNETMQSYYLDDNLRRQVLVTLVRYVGTTAFNQLLMRKNFCTWKRGMQI